MVGVGWIGFLLGFVMVIGAVVEEEMAFVGVGFLLMLVAGIVGAVAQSRTGSPSTIDLDFIWVKGLSRKFIDQLPPFVD